MINLSGMEKLTWPANMPTHAFKVEEHARLNYAN